MPSMSLMSLPPSQHTVPGQATWSWLWVNIPILYIVPLKLHIYPSHCLLENTLHEYFTLSTPQGAWHLPPKPAPRPALPVTLNGSASHPLSKTETQVHPLWAPSVPHLHQPLWPCDSYCFTCFWFCSFSPPPQPPPRPRPPGLLQQPLHLGSQLPGPPSSNPFSTL